MLVAADVRKEAGRALLPLIFGHTYATNTVMEREGFLHRVSVVL